MTINLPMEEMEDARIALVGVREAEAARKKAEKAASSGGGSKKRKSEAAGGDDSSSKKLKHHKSELVVDSVVVTLAGGVGGAGGAKVGGSRLVPKSVADELAAAEERRKLEGMSAAVRSLYAPKDGKKEEKHGNDNWMTRGAFTRVSPRIESNETRPCRNRRLTDLSFSSFSNSTLEQTRSSNHRSQSYVPLPRRLFSFCLEGRRSWIEREPSLRRPFPFSVSSLSLASVFVLLYLSYDVLVHALFVSCKLLVQSRKLRFSKTTTDQTLPFDSRVSN